MARSGDLYIMVKSAKNPFNIVSIVQKKRKKNRRKVFTKLTASIRTNI